MAAHPDLQAEQALVDRARARLVAMRRTAEQRLRAALGQGGSGTPQSLLERDVMVEHALERLDQLALGDESPCFGRIDREEGETFHIGRLAVAEEDHSPLVIDWRVPAAEPFYRATGRHPMGLSRRRHLLTEGSRVVDLEDEIFGAVDGASDAGARDGALAGPAALLSALERSRTGRMTDIVATVQAEQDEIIRAPLAGVLVVQGGPGTGKTAVALHRAAYLLYTHRFPLERQGVLLVGPNRLFLRYIEHVLPSLGETGVELATPSTLLPGVTVTGTEVPDLARLKGDPRMSAVLRRAVSDRERPLRQSLEVGLGRHVLRLSAADTAEVVSAVRRRSGSHNGRRRLLERLLFARMHAHLEERSPGEVDPRQLQAQLRRRPEVREALERMWPVLTPAELVHDLLGAPPLIELAARRSLTAQERAALYRPRSPSVEEVPWTAADAALIDEVLVHLGPVGRDEDRRVGTYGHIVVDEAQDLSPMQLRMLGRRSISGSMTLVGDLAQATGPWAPGRWGDVVGELGPSRGWRQVELSVNYRTPAEIMAVAESVLAEAAPNTIPPRSVRTTGTEPRFQAVTSGDLPSAVSDCAADEARRQGTVAVVCSPSLRPALAEAMSAAGLDMGQDDGRGLRAPVTLLEVAQVKGLEFDSVLVVEPDALVAESPQGWRSLYVALSRATRRLTIVHSRPLPAALSGRSGARG